ncbi:MAG: cobalt ECF transporter T component CbiQ [Verrucomicrobiae bacterium]|nr:cobalt ECF transporter T component CbiQ [Verrucomicrobiae bacterium]MDW8342889.1 cobalt ECF transporter T component CbiQ [Verrucomicrobiae bacterium]
MRHDFFDRYSRQDTLVHRASAAVKLIAALALIALILVAPITAVDFFVALGLTLVVIALVARIPWRYICGRLIWLEPFVLGVAALSLLQPGGLWVFLTIVVKSTFCLVTMVLLANTTPFAELLSVVRRAGVPALLVTTLALLYRYLFVLVDEAQRMHRARRARTFHRGRVGVWRDLGMIIGQLFVRSTERAERIYAAMLARGWK